MNSSSQLPLFSSNQVPIRTPPKAQLLKWIGNKQRFAANIVSFFPPDIHRYFEPFLGSGAVLATLNPSSAVGSDSFGALIDIWRALKETPDLLVEWYAHRWNRMVSTSKAQVYEAVKASYNAAPNAADLLFLARSCYGGVVRFRQADGYMSTPCGVHHPIPPASFARRVAEWHARVQGTSFLRIEFEEAMNMAHKGDLVYCDPPYSDTQAILYGAQSFGLERLLSMIDQCKSRGVLVALSIDGTKRSGRHNVQLHIPKGLFAREVMIDVGRSMLKRFQMNGQSLHDEIVQDRLLLTY